MQVAEPHCAQVLFGIPLGRWSSYEDEERFSGNGASMAGGELGKGLYDHLYRRFFEQRDSHDGYSFQQAPGGSAKLPTVTFKENLRWWTWNRWARRKKILEERDRLQREILQIKKPINTR